MQIRRNRTEFTLFVVIFLYLFTQSCVAQPAGSYENTVIATGAEQTDKYLELLKNKRIGLVVNQTSTIGSTHLLDTLLSLKVDIKKIFAPEHGFRGNHEAGAYIQNETDVKTGLPVISLYGKNKKPTASQLADIDIIIFDIQDVGVRFYTYISTLHYVMEAAAEQAKLVIVLDRPNPNGFYFDGPILDTAYRSFVGMHPVPVVHGLTVGEYAEMINGEKWLANGILCKLKVIPVNHYSRRTKYKLPIFPSPNLQNMTAIYLYPTTCFFEGTNYSLGRGTPFPFEVAGRPGLPETGFSFKPVPIKGVSDNPPHPNKVCNGYRYTARINSDFFLSPGILIDILVDAYRNDPEKEKFFIPFFDKLAGSDLLRKQIIDGDDAPTIKKSWEPGLKKYAQMRKPYLLYP
jgi:uncharacterized protein YbbC (DUF1343 family)